MNRLSTKTAQLVGMGILTALVIVLQTFASGFKIGTFSPPLSLIPIIMGAVLFGALAGAGIFSVGMLTVFYPLLAQTASTAGAENVILFYFTVFIGIGFIFNLAFVAILVPGLLRIIKIIKN